MPVWTGPRDVVQDLVNRFSAVVPPELASPSRLDNQDDIYTVAEMLCVAEGVSTWLTRELLVSNADGPFLKMHARANGLFPQSNETDLALRSRIQTPPLTITRDLILSALQGIVNGTGLTTLPVFLVELPRSAEYFSRVGIVAQPSPASTVNSTPGAFFSRPNAYMGDAVVHMVIALVPAKAKARQACSDALRAKVAPSKAYFVEEYS